MRRIIIEFEIPEEYEKDYNNVNIKTIFENFFKLEKKYSEVKFNIITECETCKLTKQYFDLLSKFSKAEMHSITRNTYWSECMDIKKELLLNYNIPY